MFRSKTAIMCAVAAVLGLGSATVSGATVYFVSPGDDIQAAIDLADTGDTIQFSAGTYTVTSELHIANKGITLQGMGKALGTTIQRDAGSLDDHRILFIENAAPVGSYDPALATVINGFTFKNGIAATGGNIYVKEAPYTIIENSIIEHGSASSGGGITMDVGGTLRNSIVRNNSTPTGGLFLGGGAYLRFGGNFIENSILYNNDSAVGGGVALQYSGIDNDPAFGGADSRSRVTNSTIADNLTGGYLGLVYGGGVGSQLYGKEAFITDSIVAFNLGGANPNDIENITIANGGTLTVSYTDNEAASYPGTGNINADPLFTSIGAPWEYYRLQAGSPALTTSSTSGPMGAQLDQSTFQVPEPTSLGLLGLAGLALLSRRRRCSLA